MSALAGILLNTISGAILNQITRASNNPNVSLNAGPGTAHQVAHQAAQEVLRAPELQHLTSTEGPWRSRAHWSSVVSVLAPFAGLVGYNVSSTHQELIGAGLWVVGNLASAFLAQRARTATKPLGR